MSVRHTDPHLVAARVGAEIPRLDKDHMPCWRCGITRARVSRKGDTGLCRDCLVYRADFGLHDPWKNPTREDTP